jgi:hypothetical protein
MDKDTKISLLMKSLSTFYQNQKYIDEIKSILDQNNTISLRILDWFITNYSKKNKTIIKTQNDIYMDVYMNYKLMLKSYGKINFDPFCRKSKIDFYYTDSNYIETSCGQLCFFKWCFENDIITHVKSHMNVIEQDMKNALKVKELNVDNVKRQPLSTTIRTISRQDIKYVLKF